MEEAGSEGMGSENESEEESGEESEEELNSGEEDSEEVELTSSAGDTESDSSDAEVPFSLPFAFSLTPPIFSDMSHTPSFLSISPTFRFLFEADGDKSVLLEWIEQAAAVPRVKDATRRCAIVNLDWERVRAVDLYAVLRSFLPTGGVLRSVAILLSDFGESQQAQEARLGPSIWHANGGTSEVEPSTVEAHGASGAVGAREEGEEGEEGEDEEGGTRDKNVENEKIRRYELDRLKYYFAVATFDSSATAEHVYSECDGAEFEASSMTLDLRFIPEEMRFTRAPRDEATCLPPKYKSPSFLCAALQQSSVKVCSLSHPFSPYVTPHFPHISANMCSFVCPSSSRGMRTTRSVRRS